MLESRVAEERKRLAEEDRRKREEEAARKKREAEEKQKAQAEAKFKADAPARKKVSELLKDDVWKQQNGGLQRSASETAAELRRVLGVPSQQKTPMQKLCDMAWEVNTPDWKTNCLPLAQANPALAAAGSQAAPAPASLTRQQYDYLRQNAAVLQPEQRSISNGLTVVAPAPSMAVCSTFAGPSPAQCPSGGAAARVPVPAGVHERNPFTDATPESIAASEARQREDAEREWNDLTRRVAGTRQRTTERCPGRTEVLNRDYVCIKPGGGYGRFCHTCTERRTCEQDRNGRDVNCTDWQEVSCGEKVCK